MNLMSIHEKNHRLKKNVRKDSLLSKSREAGQRGGLLI